MRGRLGYRIWDLLHVYNQTDDGSSGKELSRTDGRTNERTGGFNEEDVDFSTAGVKNNRKVWTEKFVLVSCQVSELLDSKLVFHSGNFESNLTLPQYTLQSICKMDKYEDLGLEASKFIEDLNMYEASRDGLFRTRRDVGNNPDFEETRKVFASKMTKIHMQKHQEEMARNNQAMKMNGGHNSAYHTKDRPPINSNRQAGEAAAKPPILSGPAPGTAAANQYAPFDGQKHHTGVQSELPTGRAYGCGNNYDNKESLEPHAYQHTTHIPSSPGNASHNAPTHARHPVSQPAVWAPSTESQISTAGSGSSSASQPPRQPTPPSSNSVPPQHFQTDTSFGNWTLPSSSRGLSREPTGTSKSDLIPSLPLSAFIGEADLHVQQPATQASTHYDSQSSRPSFTHNGSTPMSPFSSSPTETSQHKPQKVFSASAPSSIARDGNQIQSKSQAPGFGHGTEADVLCSSTSTQPFCQSLLTQPQEQGFSAAEIKLEAITKRLEKEMDSQPKADYFGKVY